MYMLRPKIENCHVKDNMISYKQIHKLLVQHPNLYFQSASTIREDGKWLECGIDGRATDTDKGFCKVATFSMYLQARIQVVSLSKS